ncbi:hypothetical protein Kisp01_67970 [Kineosporia sp. NBRC 101677]|nr:hypothetical protein Kisp01_67970 [Kineosporia sp. NBRC 101677]
MYKNTVVCNGVGIAVPHPGPMSVFLENHEWPRAEPSMGAADLGLPETAPVLVRLRGQGATARGRLSSSIATITT